MKMRSLSAAVLLLCAELTHAAISVVAVGAQTEGNTATQTPAIPTGTTNSDTMFLVSVSRGDADGATTPGSGGATSNITFSASGWTECPGDATSYMDVSATHDLTINCKYKVAGGSESAPTVTVSNDGLYGWTTQIITLRGVDTVAPFDVNGVDAQDSSVDALFTQSNVTTLTNGAYVISLVASADDNALAFQSGGGQSFTAAMSGASYDTSIGSDHAVGVGYKAVAVAGSTTMPTWEQTVLGNDRWAGLTFALEPAGAAACPATCAGGRVGVCITSTAGATDPDNILYGQAPAIGTGVDTICPEAVSDILADNVSISQVGNVTFGSGGSRATDNFEYCVMYGGAACNLDGTFEVASTPVTTNVVGVGTAPTTATVTATLDPATEGSVETTIITETSYETYGAPSHDGCMAGLDGNGAAAAANVADATPSASQSFPVTGLMANTRYVPVVCRVNGASTPIPAAVQVGNVFSTLAAGDTTPTAFDYTDLIEATPSGSYCSAPLQLSGTDAVAIISVAGGRYKISADNVNWSAETSAEGTISPGYWHAACGDASSEQGQFGDTTVTIGGVSGTYRITTYASGSPPFDGPYEPDSPFGALPSIPLAHSLITRPKHGLPR